MGQKYAQFEAEKAGYNVVGHYDDDIHETIPEGAIPITDEQWQLSCACRLRIENGEPVEYVPPARTLADAKSQAISAIKSIRETGLARFTKNSGVSRIYSENLAMARALIAGDGDTTFAADGKTAAEYLAGLGSKMGKTAEEFAAYIVSENLAVGPMAYDIEARYLALIYVGDPGAGIVPVDQMTTVEECDDAATAYRAFCGL